MATIRLHKAIADAGVASRRAAEEMIREGRVAVNGEIVTAMGVTVEPQKDTITIDGAVIGKAGRKRTYLFYKPLDVLCTRNDPHGRKTVFDLLSPEVGTGLHTAGRLDLDAEGLLILTNDGELTQKLTHPSSHLPKTYLVKVKGEVELRSLKKLRRGVELEDGLTLPASVSVIKGMGTERNTWLRIVLREGRKNQIKRMCDAVGHRVLSIKRISIGRMTLPEKMKPGMYKKLSRKEIETMMGGKDWAVQAPASRVQGEEPTQEPEDWVGMLEEKQAQSKRVPRPRSGSAPRSRPGRDTGKGARRDSSPGEALRSRTRSVSGKETRGEPSDRGPETGDRRGRTGVRAGARIARTGQGAVPGGRPRVPGTRPGTGERGRAVRDGEGRGERAVRGPEDRSHGKRVRVQAGKPRPLSGRQGEEGTRREGPGKTGSSKPGAQGKKPNQKPRIQR